MSGAFSAFALPRGVDTTRLARIVADVGSDAISVEYLDADAAWIQDVVAELEAAREELVGRPATEIAKALGAVGERFLEPGDALREEALSLLPAASGLSPQMATVVLNGMAVDWQEDRLLTLLEAEFGSVQALDGLAPGPTGTSMPLGPKLCTQFVSGSVPGVGVTALIRSLLVKSPTLLKPGLGDVVLPTLFARALREDAPALADALAVVYWPGGSDSLEDAAMERAELVVAYGGDAAVASLRARTGVSVRFRAYHHRMSVGLVAKEALSAEAVGQVAAAVAGSVAMFDQRGCVSPQVVFVEEGGATSPGEFAGALASAMASLETTLPGGALDPAEASTVHQLRGTAELMSASGRPVEVRHGGGSMWTVIFDPDAELDATCVGRVIRVRPIREIAELPALLEPHARHLQTVGTAGLEGDLSPFAERLGRAGVSRVVPFHEVAFPPAWWHHDGGGPLRDLVRYIDVGA